MNEIINDLKELIQRTEDEIEYYQGTAEEDFYQGALLAYQQSLRITEAKNDLRRLEA